MAEAVAAIAAVVHAVETAMMVKDFIDSILGAPKAVLLLSKDVEALSTVLVALATHLHNMDISTNKAQASLIRVLQPPLENCIGALNTIKTTLKPFVKPTGEAEISKWKSMTWKYREQEIQTLQNVLMSYKQSLDIAIAVANFSNSTNEFQSLKEEIHKLRKRIDHDSTSLITSEYEGSEVAPNDYGFALQRFLSDTETVIGDSRSIELVSTDLGAKEQLRVEDELTFAGADVRNPFDDVHEADASVEPQIETPSEEKLTKPICADEGQFHQLEVPPRGGSHFNKLRALTASVAEGTYLKFKRPSAGKALKQEPRQPPLLRGISLPNSSAAGSISGQSVTDSCSGGQHNTLSPPPCSETLIQNHTLSDAQSPGDKEMMQKSILQPLIGSIEEPAELETLEKRNVNAHLTMETVHVTPKTARLTPEAARLTPDAARFIPETARTWALGASRSQGNLKSSLQLGPDSTDTGATEDTRPTLLRSSNSQTSLASQVNQDRRARWEAARSSSNAKQYSVDLRTGGHGYGSSNILGNHWTPVSGGVVRVIGDFDR